MKDLQNFKNKIINNYKQLTMSILEKAFESMPNVFTSNKFGSKLRSLGYPETLIKQGFSDYLSRHSVNQYAGSKTWIKNKVQYNIQAHTKEKQYSFDSMNEIIEFVKSKGYKVLKQEWTEL
jgi:hypothetical protein